jgi:membrane protein DedA with SNARE-associated domain
MALDGQLQHLVATYGAWLVGAIVGLESMGIPLPGETTLVTAALYAGATGRLSIAAVVFAAAAGAIVGDNIGFWIGRTLGYRWVVRHQSALRLTPKRLRLGQYLFDRHGGKVVFLGRFVAVLRAFAALLAGLNRMRWRRFLVFNMMGAIVWASAYGGGAYAFGDKLTNVLGETGILLSAAAAALVVIGFLLARKYERRVSDEAERHVPLTRET